MLAYELPHKDPSGAKVLLATQTIEAVMTTGSEEAVRAWHAAGERRKIRLARSSVIERARRLGSV
jgi:hypothetical protein